MRGWDKARHFGRCHCIVGHDGSRRSRLIVSRWYVEVTVRGYFLNVGAL